MSSQAPELLSQLSLNTTPLSTSLDRHRRLIFKLNQNMFTELLETCSCDGPISPETKITDFEDFEDFEAILEEEWDSKYEYEQGQKHPTRIPIFPPSVKAFKDIYPLLSNGTSPPLPNEERENYFRKIEAALTAQAAPKFRPVTLPDDFKQLCALTDELHGAGMPKSRKWQSPSAFNGLCYLLFDLTHGNDDMTPLSVAQLLRNSGMEDGGMDFAAGMQTGSLEQDGGTWLALCKDDRDEDTDPETGESNWRWVWFACNDLSTEEFESVSELVDKFWCLWRSNIYRYKKLDYDSVGESTP